MFASADGANMQKVVTTGQVTADPVDFTANKLTIVVKKGNPKGVKSLADLPKLGIISLCAAAVPCGKYATQMLSQDGVTIPTDKITLGQDVKATLTAVQSGDADAALVYATDAKAPGTTVTKVKIPASLNVLAIYPIAPIAASQNAKLADAWIQYVLSPGGPEDAREVRLPPRSHHVTRRGRGVPLIAVLLAGRGRVLRPPADRVAATRAWSEVWDDLSTRATHATR